MLGPIARVVRFWLRVPADPRPPAGSAASVRVFRAAHNYYRYALARWALTQVGALIAFVVFFSFGPQMLGWIPIGDPRAGAVIEKIPGPIVRLVDWFRIVEQQRDPDDPERTRYAIGPGLMRLEWIGLTAFFVQLPFSFMLVRLDYELRWYIVTDCSLRVREGVTTVRESTMTFDNIQNLSIHQGPIQRLLGIADLKVRTAGGGPGSEDGGDEDDEDASMHIVYFRGVDDAPGLRDTILDWIRDDHPVPSGDGPTIAAARGLLDEARRLREAVESARRE